MRAHVALGGGLFVALLVALSPPRAAAHCDTAGGPVVQAGERALRTGELHHALIWVEDEHAAELKKAFTSAQKVRKLSRLSRDVADRWFLETLVRLHRLGEGEAYAGIQPSPPPDPASIATDRAIETGRVDVLVDILSEDVRSGLQTRFARLRAASRFDPADVKAGRRFADAYVDFVHYVEAIRAAAHGEDGHHE